MGKKMRSPAYPQYPAAHRAHAGVVRREGASFFNVGSDTFMVVRVNKRHFRPRRR